MACIDDAPKSDVHPRYCIRDDKMKQPGISVRLGRACTVASPDRRLLRVFPASADASVMSMALTASSDARPNNCGLPVAQPTPTARRVARQNKRRPGLHLTDRSFCSWRPLGAPVSRFAKGEAKATRKITCQADQWPGLEAGQD
ncbi:hypothetical protein COCC4DRAFT_131927 [Bipolaris maydis ATCC 48331]|uniref:Uncharacterized protein n=2 Tax=Cochliobolus heterostrophus TaxID=5016 RepID=M2UJP8_COCH5|nr:uncharacterized protein COCC4DRAFT_131927 [Bipolaris maydis ATCC 48331]EMD93871.1 hypothetical protein COCHEDRAFT_1027841 [Bipolaris maydis C5]ENI07825.1 hypothetical protein COCC4DRAFT_131927 [Bipolaris maydis ATCC 48331]